MEPLRMHKGTTVTLMNDHIDTDQIIPKQFLKRIERTGFGQFLFDEWRFLDDRSPNPSFPLNEPSRQGASVLITGENFGCGSSREHAPWALHDYGFKVIIAGSFADIFYMNCTKNGMLPIVLPKEARAQLASLSADETIEVDLDEQVVKASCGEYPFDIEHVWKEKLLNGLDDIAITLQYEAQIALYEEKISIKS
ncbi:3-isopropylmalate dehydratase small subunit [Priestia taiwanensis]|uniref:3-isopropylmalate dehydratase small subunit n=1 Tax=Priestia taiwanensis TaxID=1347902 RepID=A0A917ERW3_9BACI|nr:3-isopropylmalate dehydratase small subunit [Priestia taiwanensis]MBM7364717.1 3-isopropylmalate/(R)-2-methylmalate dehydratase small subunit [Priestia taiwanensis]GGE79079.1 3-isopropylmalate dehydratase small subunit [Priestia taiwanensis]